MIVFLAVEVVHKEKSSSLLSIEARRKVPKRGRMRQSQRYSSQNKDLQHLPEKTDVTVEKVDWTSQTEPLHLDA